MLASSKKLEAKTWHLGKGVFAARDDDDDFVCTLTVEFSSNGN